MGPVGPIHLLGPVGAIHLLGPGPGPIHFQSFLMENVIVGHFLFRTSFFDSILELCRTRRKRLYVLQEINPRWLQMKKCFFRKNWGRDQTLEVKGYVLVVKVQCFPFFFRKDERKRIKVRAFSTLRIGLSCHMRSTFEESVFRQKRFSEILTFLNFFGG